LPLAPVLLVTVVKSAVNTVQKVGKTKYYTEEIRAMVTLCGIGRGS
jgi:hypothetical protein